jgi:hypothetical protein
MITLLSTLWLISIIFSIAVYLRHAYANYPKSWRWELLLVGSSFVWGCISGAIILLKDYSGVAFVLGVLAFGSAAAILYRFFFMDNLRHLIPKRTRTHDKNGE